MFLILEVVLPLSLIISALAAIVWKRNRKTKNILAGWSISGTRKSHLIHAEKLLGAVILTFVAFWSPFFFYWGLYTACNFFCRLSRRDRRHQMGRLTVLVESMNSAVDPFSYIFGSSVLRSQYKQRIGMLYTKVLCSLNNKNHTEVSVTKIFLSEFSSQGARGNDRFPRAKICSNLAIKTHKIKICTKLKKKTPQEYQSVTLIFLFNFE